MTTSSNTLLLNERMDRTEAKSLRLRKQLTFGTELSNSKTLRERLSKCCQRMVGGINLRVVSYVVRVRAHESYVQTTDLEKSN